MAKLLLLGPARDAAGMRHDVVDAATVAEALRLACDRYGASFAEILASSQVWVNGEPCELDQALEAHDEIAVLPPVSGG